MTTIEVRKIVSMMVAAYPQSRLGEDSQKLYESILKPFPATPTQEAVLEILTSDREFCPPVGVIVQAATKRALFQANREVLAPEEAWGLVQDTIRFRGYYRGPGAFGRNVAIQRAVDAIGWSNLCHDQNVAATRAHFMRIVERFQEREVAGAVAILSKGDTLPAIEAENPIERRVISALPDEWERKRVSELVREYIKTPRNAVHEHSNSSAAERERPRTDPVEWAAVEKPERQ